jgi:hypothetical protein
MAEDTDLVPDPRQIRTSWRLNLADNLKPATGITLSDDNSCVLGDPGGHGQTFG